MEKEKQADEDESDNVINSLVICEGRVRQNRTLKNR